MARMSTLLGGAQFAAFSLWVQGGAMAKNIAVFGIYPTYGAVDGAVESLRASGFRNTDISVLFPENTGTKDFAHEKGTKASEGAATGGTTGAIIGGTLGWLAGIGMLAIPGLGPFIAAGSIIAGPPRAGARGGVGGVPRAACGGGRAHITSEPP